MPGSQRTFRSNRRVAGPKYETELYEWQGRTFEILTDQWGGCIINEDGKQVFGRVNEVNRSASPYGSKSMRAEGLAFAKVMVRGGRL